MRKSIPDRSEQAQRLPGRRVRIIGYLLFAVLWLSILILLFVLFGQNQGTERVGFMKMKHLGEIDASREGGHLHIVQPYADEIVPNMQNPYIPFQGCRVT